MGMFDYIRCEYRLPHPAAQDLQFQCKDTPAQGLFTYTISEDGYLYEAPFGWEDQTDPVGQSGERKWRMPWRYLRGDKAHGFLGEIRFYANGYEYSAYFVDGKVLHLATVQSPDSVGG